MEILIPTPLHSYTAGQGRVHAEGATLDEVITDLERQFPGIRFRMIDEQGRMRAHMRIFVNGAAVFELPTPLRDSDKVAIVQALSGG
ncbi:MAG: molybdopterin synthase sulfur carrier subunit [Betaproteobacteria bacterium HGW-Betaproteobacteria-21]|nr:MAG: molybdopterin synthase sulfur carrier subunit [Betaproteobacteria bacterium HGW-Betaproteobacteria-21]